MKNLNSILSQKWPEYIIEIIVIILGITISFLIDEWREDREKSQLLKKSLYSMKAELIRDTVNLNERYEYYVSTVEFLFPILKNKNILLIRDRSFLTQNQDKDMLGDSIRSSHYFNSLTSTGVPLLDNTSSYRSMVANSLSSYIRTPSLREEIFQYYENDRKQLLSLEESMASTQSDIFDIHMERVNSSKRAVAIYFKDQSLFEKSIEEINNDLNKLLLEKKYVELVNTRAEFMLFQISTDVIKEPKNRAHAIIRLIDQELTN